MRGWACEGGDVHPMCFFTRPKAKEIIDEKGNVWVWPGRDYG